MLKYVFIFILLININQGNDDNIVSNIVDDIQQPTNITCLCTEDEQCDSNRRTCRLNNSDQACYQSWTKIPGDNTIYLSAGCVYNNFFFTRIYCNGNETNRYIICCSDKDYCNDRDAYSGDIRKILTKKNKSDKHLFKLILTIIVSISSLLLLIIFFILLFIRRYRRNSPNELNKHQGLLNYLCPQSKNSVNAVKTTEVPIEISTSSSGCGQLSETNKLIRSYLRTKRFPDQITIGEKIGVGGYGCVYRGRWYDDDIAVKIFLSSERPSWEREVEIYKTPGLNHENILRYIAADNTDISNRIELWLATEYHENGSVYDYLMNHTITIPILIKMLFSIVDGLWRLHMPIDASDGKVAFAHRDLKTKNILVRRDLSCCIADLGLAVKEERKQQNSNQESVSIDIKAVHRVGTIRYMAPEILDKNLNVQSFDSYKAADMYALGLVYWEILRRCQTAPGENDVDTYELPYQTILPNNPSFEDMQDVVCVRKIRPLPSPRWKNNPILNSIFELCEDLWSEKPASRPNSCYIKRELKQKCETIDNELLSINTKSRNEGPQTV